MPPLPPNGNTHHIAPLPHLLIVQPVDRLVAPGRAGAGGGQRARVGGVGLGVDDQEDELIAVIAVHPDLDPCGLALGSGDHGMPGLQSHAQQGFPGDGIDDMGGGDQPKVLPDGRAAYLGRQAARWSSRSALPPSSLGMIVMR